MKKSKISPANLANRMPMQLAQKNRIPILVNDTLTLDVPANPAISEAAKKLKASVPGLINCPNNGNFAEADI